jgi:pimeloyl-ACP methyl ester carboxylesterase
MTHLILRRQLLTITCLFLLLNVFGQAPAVKPNGKFLMINGFKMYYEEHGKGKPLLLIHGNNESGESMKYQVEYFKKTRRVIVADSRAHGRSGFVGNEDFNYDMLTADWAALIDKLSLEQADVFGWSDGGIIGILLAKDHPRRIDKVYAFGANTKLPPEAVLPEVDRGLNKFLATLPDTGAGVNTKKLLAMMTKHPDIPWEELRKVNKPITVATADRDLILVEHSVKIYRHLPMAHLEVFPNQSHFMVWDDHQKINKAAEEFFNKPFKPVALVPKEFEFLIDK